MSVEAADPSERVPAGKASGRVGICTFEKLARPRPDLQNTQHIPPPSVAVERLLGGDLD
jgi:hypothetical protein